MCLWVIFLINRQIIITKENTSEKDDVEQRTGQVVCVVSPEEVSSKINATYQIFTKLKRIVGTLKCLDCVSGYKALLQTECENSCLVNFSIMVICNSTIISFRTIISIA